MRKIILGLAVSLDGFIEGPNGEYDWCFTDQDYGMSAFFNRIDAMLIGRKSYEVLKKADPETVPFPPLQEYIVSTTMKQAPEGTVLLSGDVGAAVNKIRQSEGKDIWLFGGAELTASLLRLGLVDELWLSIHPILLGSGKPLFTGLDGRRPLRLLESKTYDTGLVSVRYAIG